MPTTFIKSPLLEPSLHGFTTRKGGVSAPPYDSLNLGKKWGDAPAAVDQNLARVALEAGFSTVKLCRQVHGATICEARATDDVAVIEADAIIACDPGMTVGVSIADCVPILFYDPRSGLVAAAHAGWRGTVARIASLTAKRLRALGASDELRAALGPSICGKCFEVGPEVAAQFGVSTRTVDLHAQNAAQLQEAGVKHVDAAPWCTFHMPELFFSYRRDQGRTGSHLAFIGR